MELYYARTISDRKSVCISTLTDDQLRESGALERFGGIGYYLYERTILDGDEEIEVLARLWSDEAARQLAELLGCIDPRELACGPLPISFPLPRYRMSKRRARH